MEVAKDIDSWTSRWLPRVPIARPRTRAMGNKHSRAILIAGTDSQDHVGLETTFRKNVRAFSATLLMFRINMPRRLY